MLFDHRLFSLILEKRRFNGQNTSVVLRLLHWIYKNPFCLFWIGIGEWFLINLLNLPIPFYRGAVAIMVKHLPGNPSMSGNYIRAAYYKKKLKKMGKNVLIEEGVIIGNPSCTEIDDMTLIDKGAVLNAGEIRIGKCSHICYNTMLLGSGRIEVGDYCAVSHAAQLLSSSEVPRDGARVASTMVPFEQRNVKVADIIIKKDGFVGAGAIIMPGVIIEEGGIIGAGVVAFEGTKPWEIKYGRLPEKLLSKERQPVSFKDLEE